MMEITQRLWTVYCRAVRVKSPDSFRMMEWSKEMVDLTQNMSMPDEVMAEILKTLEWCESKFKTSDGSSPFGF